MRKRFTNRQIWERMYDHKYRDLSTQKDLCYYCGFFSDTMDHCPALSWIDMWGLGYFEEYGIDLIKVSACKQCNSVLSARKLFYLDERKQFLSRYYESKYQSLLKMPIWTMGEIDLLRGRLKEKIAKAARAKAVLERG